MSEKQIKSAVGYVRVSTIGQAVDGVSLEAQSSKIRQWCELNGYDLIAIHKDAGISGRKTSNRPGVKAAVSESCEHQAALVCYSLSRIARSTKNAMEISERLDKSGADMVSISEHIDTTSAAGKMVFRLLAVLAEFESDMISERTKASLALMKAKGMKLGGQTPFGYSDENGYLVKNRKEQQAIKLMKRLRLDGYSLRKIASELERRGIETRTGATWTPKVIKGILEKAA